MFLQWESQVLLKLMVIFGPMFSGKTTELIRRLKRYQIARRKCLVVKYARDDRYHSTCVATHDKDVLPAVCSVSLQPLSEEAMKFDVIGIDEGQFFADVVPFCEKMANLGKIVMVAALDGTYRREGFGDILKLVPLAESVVKLNAVCMLCFKSASYTKRIGCEQELEVIGGAEKYMSVCRECYLAPYRSPSKRSPLKCIPAFNEVPSPKRTMLQF
ncbi:thymidine kinase, cytosolic-like isoform X2 [Ischnura elegans]|uniref:thymidine kinase, cytosolic-like isoform X2 n=1 Tax=Ischnura elegans TaxID=197161 RepID=UPI001ED878C4|nr:thymidine kinase, cytosolic-like isoform X2 [Ischnura elegans]